MNRSHAFGDFGSQLIYAPLKVTPECMLPTNTMFGTPKASTIVWGSFTDEDGVDYALCREFPGYNSVGCWVMSTAAGDGLAMTAETATMWRGGIAIDHDGDRIEWTSTDIYQGSAPAMRLEVDGDTMRFDERGAVAIVAERAAPGYQFYDPVSVQGWTEQAFVATGTIADKKVVGWLGIAGDYQAPGVNYRISPAISGGLLINWNAFYNIFEDGSWEYGTIIGGRHGYTFAFIMNDKGQVSHSRDVVSDYEVREDGWPLSMTFRYADARTGKPMAWQWKLTPGTEMFELPKLAPHLLHKRSCEGHCLRIDEQRTLLRGTCWPEFIADGRLDLYKAELAAVTDPAEFR